MNIALFADGVNRASVSTSSAIDTLVINCVGHGTFLLYKFLLSKTSAEFTSTLGLCPAQTTKILQQKYLQFDWPYINLSQHVLCLQNTVKPE
jgi:hypothetical protein